ncbi:hypothetical protein ACJRO7_020344 [Eucalyptus globulus]|uniref:Calcium ion binding protein n=1 Tax=Eucalyptus globulus TaxID=34317 RepID=A0ABD3KID3_EUCGL
MGTFLSSLGKGGPRPPPQMVGFFMGALYNQFVEKDITNFEAFHIAILDIFNTFNAALPGKHVDIPSQRKVEECFRQWKEANKDTKKKKVFVNFMTENVTVSKLDDSTVIIGVLTPPVAMAAKKAGENVPQLMLIKNIPDVIFVPAATVLALISVKLSGRILNKSIVPPERKI